MNKQKATLFLLSLSGIIGFFILWELFIYFFSIREYIFPSPFLVFQAFVKHWHTLVTSSLITFYEAAIGFLFANLSGLIVAILFSQSRTLESMFLPLFIALKATPVVALAPLLILWFSIGIYSKIAMAALICFFPIIVNGTRGLSNVDSELLDFVRSFSGEGLKERIIYSSGAIGKKISTTGRVLFFTAQIREILKERLKILWHIRFPNAMPYIFGALKISSTLSVIGAIVAEMNGSSEGIGYIILSASYRSDVPTILSAAFCSSIIGVSFFYLIVLIEKIFWPFSMNLNIE